MEETEPGSWEVVKTGTYEQYFKTNMKGKKGIFKRQRRSRELQMGIQQ
jgi:hypothetical protein